MADLPFDAVGFDLDGTLLDTFRDLGAAVNHALELGGFDPVPVDSSKDLIGGGAKIMLARAVDQQGGMPEDEFHVLYKKMLRFYADNNAVRTQPYPGVIEVLDDLDGRGVKMAVVTNKFAGFATTILETLGLADRFAAIIGGDSMGRGPDGKHLAKPHPAPVLEARRLCGEGRFAFVGDSSYDVAAARAAQVPVVVAAYGYCDKPVVELGGDAVIERFDQLLPTLERM
ncbi:MAG: HAD hydrolase-like protein [Sphingomonas sp.]|jgi:phosphoglycolate phosphatase|nr:HAD hydrolase-like protein [Sphingomonas sp.]RZV32338.1 MAG: HAD family hydrolase [Sphingomonadaceae bacterium]